MAADWVWTVEVPMPAERLFIVCLEAFGCDEKPTGITMPTIRKYTAMSERRIKEAANHFAHYGLLQWQQSYAGKPSLWSIPADEASPFPPQTPPFPSHRVLLRKTPGDRDTTYSTIPEPDEFEDTVDKDKARRDADAIVKYWYATTYPRPTNAGGFPAARKLVEKMILAGWTSDQVKDALPQVPVLTAASLEYQLRRKSPSAGPTTPPKPRGPAQCWNCKGHSQIKSPEGMRCLNCNELWDV